MKILLFLLVAFTPLRKDINYISKADNKNEIIYQKGNKLKWSDFKEIKLKDASAQTETGISYQYETIDTKINITVSCRFYKENSFVDKSKKNYYLLNHEQRHFDITYIYAKKFIERLRYSDFNSEKGIKIIYEKITDEWNIFQDEYDTQTDNSIDEKMQIFWDSKIDKLLMLN